MKPSEVIEVLTALIPVHEPAFLWGPPGCAKSSCVKQAAENIRQNNPGFGVIDIRGSQLDAVDLRGLPRVDGDETRWCRPAFLPHSGEGVLFLDELPQSDDTVRKALFQLVLDRQIGDYTLPDGWTVIAAGNRTTDRSGAGRVEAALLNRFATHIDVEVSAEDWQSWALQAGIAPEVRAFINYRPALLFDFDPSSNPRSFPTPRSWHKVANILKVTPKHLLQRVVAGGVGEGTAAEFCSFLDFYKHLPDIDAILKDPTKGSVPTEPAVLFAVISAMGDRCKANKKLTVNMARWSMRCSDEFGMLGMRDALAIDKTLVTDKAVQGWVADARKKGLFDGSL